MTSESHRETERSPTGGLTSTEAALPQSPEAPDPIKIVRSFLDQHDDRIRCNALTALAALEDSAALEELIQATRNDGSPKVRRHGIEELLELPPNFGRGRGRDIVRELATNDRDVGVRQFALQQLLEDPDDPKTAAVVRQVALNDRAPEVRKRALTLLPRLKTQGIEGLAQSAVSEPEAEVRKLAKRTLANLSAAQLQVAIQALCQWLDNPEELVDPKQVTDEAMDPLETETPRSPRLAEERSHEIYALLGRLRRAGKNVPAPSGTFWTRLHRVRALRNLPDPEVPRPWPWLGWRQMAFWVTPLMLVAILAIEWAGGQGPERPMSIYILAALGVLAVGMVSVARPTPLSLHFDPWVAFVWQAAGLVVRTLLLTSGLLLTAVLLFLEPEDHGFGRPFLTIVGLGALTAAASSLAARVGSWVVLRYSRETRWRQIQQILWGSAFAGGTLTVLHLVTTSGPPLERLPALDFFGLSILVVFLPLGIAVASLTAVTDGPAGPVPRQGTYDLWGPTGALLMVASILVLAFGSAVLQRGFWQTPPIASDARSPILKIPFERVPLEQTFSIGFLQQVRVEIEEYEEEQQVDTRFRILSAGGESLYNRDDPPVGELWLSPGEYQLQADLYGSGTVPSDTGRDSALAVWSRELFNVIWDRPGTIGSVSLELNSNQGPLDTSGEPNLSEAARFFWQADDFLKAEFRVPQPQRVQFEVLEAKESSLRLQDGFYYLEVRKEDGEIVTQTTWQASRGTLEQSSSIPSRASLEVLLPTNSYTLCMVRTPRTDSESPSNPTVRLQEWLTSLAKAFDRCRDAPLRPSIDLGSAQRLQHIELTSTGEVLEVYENLEGLPSAEAGQTIYATWTASELPTNWPLALDRNQVLQLQASTTATDLVLGVRQDDSVLELPTSRNQLGPTILRQGWYEIFALPARALPLGTRTPVVRFELALQGFSPGPEVVLGADPGEKRESHWTVTHLPFRWSFDFAHSQQLFLEVTQEFHDVVVEISSQDGRIVHRADDPCVVRAMLPKGRYDVVIEKYGSDDDEAEPIDQPETVNLVLEGQPVDPEGQEPDASDDSYSDTFERVERHRPGQAAESR